MASFMVHCTLPSELSAEFVSLIPAHRARVNELMREGTIICYALALDRSQLWAGVVADDREDVGAILETLPLHRFLEVTITETAFFESAGLTHAHFSLN